MWAHTLTGGLHTPIIAWQKKYHRSALGLQKHGQGPAILRKPAPTRAGTDATTCTRTLPPPPTGGVSARGRANVLRCTDTDADPPTARRSSSRWCLRATIHRSKSLQQRPRELPHRQNGKATSQPVLASTPGCAGYKHESLCRPKIGGGTTSKISLGMWYDFAEH